MTNPLTTADMRTAKEPAIQRSCWRSVPVARLARTIIETAPTSMRIMSGKTTVPGLITRQIERSGRRAAGLGTHAAIG